MRNARRSRCPKGDRATHDGQSRNRSKKARRIVKADITEVIDLNCVLVAAQQVCQREVNYSPQFRPKKQQVLRLRVRPTCKRRGSEMHPPKIGNRLVVGPQPSHHF
jgi:hypothetical protein